MDDVVIGDDTDLSAFGIETLESGDVMGSDLTAAAATAATAAAAETTGAPRASTTDAASVAAATGEVVAEDGPVYGTIRVSGRVTGRATLVLAAHPKATAATAVAALATDLAASLRHRIALWCHANRTAVGGDVTATDITWEGARDVWGVAATTRLALATREHWRVAGHDMPLPAGAALPRRVYAWTLAFFLFSNCFFKNYLFLIVF
jgi:hypothetical protein